MTYVSGSRNFIQDEFASGIGQFGGRRQPRHRGGRRRQAARTLAGDFTLSFFPTENITVVNNTSILSNRIDGNSSYSEVNTGLDLGTTIYFRYIGIRTVDEFDRRELPPQQVARILSAATTTRTG